MSFETLAAALIIGLFAVSFVYIGHHTPVRSKRTFVVIITHFKAFLQGQGQGQGLAMKGMLPFFDLFAEN